MKWERETGGGAEVEGRDEVDGVGRVFERAEAGRSMIRNVSPSDRELDPIPVLSLEDQ